MELLTSTNEAMEQDAESRADFVKMQSVKSPWEKKLQGWEEV